MNRDDILRMAHEADEYADRVLSPGEFHPDKHDVRDLHFAALVAAAEREACAKICESLITDGDIYPGNFVLEACAKSIRSKSE